MHLIKLVFLSPASHSLNYTESFFLSLPSYVLMKSKELVVGARVFVRRWIKSSFRFFRWYAFVLESFYLILLLYFYGSLYSFTFFSCFILHIILLHLLLIPPHPCPYFIFFSSRSLDEVSMTSRLFKYQKSNKKLPVTTAPRDSERAFQSFIFFILRLFFFAVNIFYALPLSI